MEHFLPEFTTKVNIGRIYPLELTVHKGGLKNYQPRLFLDITIV